MHDPSGINNELLAENALLRQRIQELELSDPERRRAEAALRESESFSRSLIRYMHEVVIIISWDGSILFANEAAANVVGIASPEELLGRNMVEFLHSDSLNKALEDSASVQAGIEGFLSEYRLVTAKGLQVWVESIGGKIIFSGEEENLVCLRDITERKQAEEEKRKLEERLQRAEKMESICPLRRRRRRRKRRQPRP